MRRAGRPGRCCSAAAGCGWSAALFTLALLTLALRLADLALWRGEHAASAAARWRARSAASRRADIVDRNGTLLATDYPKTSIYADPAAGARPGGRGDAASRRCCRASSRAELLARLTRAAALRLAQAPRQRGRGARGGPPRAARRRRSAPSSTGSIRSARWPPIWSATSGSRTRGWRASSAAFEDRLTGEASADAAGADPRSRRAGGGAQRARRRRARASPRWAPPASCSTSRAASCWRASACPTSTPTAISRRAPEALFNRNTLGTYELGSLFKLFTVAMALDAGAVDIADVLDASEPLQFGRYRINDFHAKRRWLSVAEVIAFSSNIGAAKMAQALGTEGQLAYFERFGLLERHPIRLPEVGLPQRPVALAADQHGDRGLRPRPRGLAAAGRRCGRGDGLRARPGRAPIWSPRRCRRSGSGCRSRPRPRPSCAG